MVKKILDYDKLDYERITEIAKAKDELDVAKDEFKKYMAAAKDEAEYNAKLAAETARREAYNSIISAARTYAKKYNNGDDRILRDFLHQAMPQEYGRLINGISDASDEKFNKLLAAIGNSNTYNIANNYGPVGAPIERQINSFGQQPNKQISQQQ